MTNDVEIDYIAANSAVTALEQREARPLRVDVCRLEQGYELAKALARGTPDRGKIISTILKDKIKEMI